MAYLPEIIEGATLGPLSTYPGPSDATVGVRGIGGTSIGFSDATLGRHILFLGGIGSGKTVGMTALVDSIRADSGPDDTFVFFDSKGDYIERFFVDGDVSLSPVRESPHPAAQLWNLFAELHDVAPADLPETVRELVASLMDASDGDQNRIWVAMASDVIAALITATSAPAGPTPTSTCGPWPTR